jgi:hypothetical protein
VQTHLSPSGVLHFLNPLTLTHACNLKIRSKDSLTVTLAIQFLSRSKHVASADKRMRFEITIVVITLRCFSECIAMQSDIIQLSQFWTFRRRNSVSVCGDRVRDGDRAQSPKRRVLIKDATKDDVRNGGSQRHKPIHQVSCKFPHACAERMAPLSIVVR